MKIVNSTPNKLKENLDIAIQEAPEAPLFHNLHI